MLKNLFQLFNLSLAIYLVLFISFYSPVLSVPVIAKEEPRIKIAVLDFKAKNVPETDAAIITDLFRDQLFNTKKFQMLDKAAIDNVIKKFNYQAAGICDVECAINIGENLQADKVINGDVNKLGAKYLISIRMVDVTDATLQLTKVFEKECRLEDLTLEMPGIISQFVEEYTNSIENNPILQEPVKIQTAETQQSIKGKLKITMVPDGATVIANDKLLGISPFEEKELEAGEYKITARKAGYELKETTVNISNGKTEEIKIELRPIEAQSGVIADRGGTAPEEEEGGGGTLWWIIGGITAAGLLAILLSSSGEESTGTLTINNSLSSVIGVKIDSVYQGTIDALLSRSWELSVGSHEIQVSSASTPFTNNNQASSLVSPQSGKSSSSSRRSMRMRNLITEDQSSVSGGFNSSVPDKSVDKVVSSYPDSPFSGYYLKTYTVNIAGGKTTSLTHGSSWDTGDAYVTSEPSGAQVWLDNANTGLTTPATLNNVVPGPHTVTCKLAGYPDVSRTVNISDGQTSNVNIELELDRWVTIPAGCFDMGDHFNEGHGDELPVHRVCISSFQMSKTEVTNSKYKACVDAGSCKPPSPTSSYTRPSYYGNSTYNDYPVIYVNWNQAKAFCAWKGGRLPTEAEWEYAARGGLAGKRYPNGDTISCSQANTCDYGIGDTDRVGIRTPNGYGLYDMAGNVFEWVSDWYDEDYYSYSPSNDPQGPSSRSYRVVRGGSWSYITGDIRVSDRGGFDTASRRGDNGFRCAK